MNGGGEKGSGLLTISLKNCLTLVSTIKITKDTSQCIRENTERPSTVEFGSNTMFDEIIAGNYKKEISRSCGVGKRLKGLWIL